MLWRAYSSLCYGGHTPHATVIAADRSRLARAGRHSRWCEHSHSRRPQSDKPELVQSLQGQPLFVEGILQPLLWRAYSSLCSGGHTPCATVIATAEAGSSGAKSSQSGCVSHRSRLLGDELVRCTAHRGICSVQMTRARGDPATHALRRVAVLCGGQEWRARGQEAERAAG